MTKRIKREPFFYSPTDYRALEEHFREMAKKGWLVNKIRFGILEYIKIEPQDLSFTIDVYPEVKVFQTPNQKDIDSYIDLVKDSGWNYIDSQNNIHIFYGREDEDLIPIQTDEEIKEAILNKSVKMEAFSTFFTLLIIINSIYTSFPITYEDLYRNTSIIVPIVMPLIFLAMLIQIGNSVLWTLRSKKRIKEGKEIPEQSYKWVKWKTILTFGISFVGVLAFFIAAIADGIMGSGLMLFVFVPVILMPLAAVIYKKQIVAMDWENWQKSASLALMILFIFLISMFGMINMAGRTDQDLEEGYLGFTLEDFNLNKKADMTSFDKNGSFLVPKKSRYTEYSRESHIRTIYVDAVNERITDYIMDKMIKEAWENERDLIPIEGYKEIEEGYYLTSNYSEEARDYDVLIKDGKRIIYLDASFDFTEKENMDIIIEKLK